MKSRSFAPFLDLSWSWICAPRLKEKLGTYEEQLHKPQQMQTIIMPLGLPQEVYSQYSSSGHFALRKGGLPSYFWDAGPRVQVELRTVCPRPASAETSSSLSVLQRPEDYCLRDIEQDNRQSLLLHSSNHVPTRPICYSILKSKTCLHFYGH